MSFFLALTFLMCLLVACLLATCTALLKRVLRLEQRFATIGSMLVPGIELQPGVHVEDLPDPFSSGVADLYVVSATCASCATVLEGICDEQSATTILVVASEVEAELIAGSCKTPVTVHPTLVRRTIASGHRLPAVVHVTNGVVNSIADYSAKRTESFERQ